ncbi:ATP-binding protein [Ruminiclostridium cellobioparum]|uniref:Histidine kinase-, DNA gyrase B-, and HSP90-like ATPase n=1 Tax=Ruminiclostridium cellobioparum subsp. termitidis CT1112 TaxID=1195236 RepID=S0FNA7_RUMCE|nr:ATP-binding protein [Ruminiclostridium cellobioparum]EMS70629.1 Histidine kinase-, DNA gyrase B-, and HSP90-like ATPase [Ruminiclostridium cellobioparum subsp. termitidis CT1112]
MPNHESVTPDAYSVIQSLRSVGYNLQSAIADIIDNSITARASEIKIRFHWNMDNSYISIHDNGNGMSENDLRQAMRMGSKNPLDRREKNDLGRFGMGLKTAAFSLCKRLTVKSGYKHDETFIRCWDLDYIKDTNDWTLITHAADNDSSLFLQQHEIKESGTVVLLEKLDRIITSPFNQKAYTEFLKKVESVEKHISMIFHRFLSGPQAVKIYINENEIKPWDPFLTNEVATQELATEQFKFGNTTITISPYILPHHSKITKGTFDRAEGLKGWNAHQGFYVYRNKRLLVAGTWFNMFKKEEPFKLARIMLDISSDLDFDWKIDIKKAAAVPPQEIVHEVEKIAKIAREASYRVYYHRGAKLAVDNTVSSVDYVWEQIYKHGILYHKVNRNHSLLLNFITTLSSEQKRMLNAYLAIVEENTPSNLLSYAVGKQENNEGNSNNSALDTEDAVNHIRDIIYAFRISGYKDDEIVNRLKHMKSFIPYERLFQRLMEETN